MMTDGKPGVSTLPEIAGRDLLRRPVARHQRQGGCAREPGTEGLEYGQPLRWPLPSHNLNLVAHIVSSAS
jgi:hypothetical protein